MNILQNSFYNSLSQKDSEDLRTILNSLPKNAVAYLVGGCVRDLLLGKTSKDFDIEIHEITLEDFTCSMEKLLAKGVGKSYFIYKYGSFDIGLPRSESKNAVGHRGFDVKIETNLNNAPKRRDFTMNAIMINLENFEKIDLVGGTTDIQDKIIRMVDEKSFNEDSLRVLRAIQFAARFGFRIETKTLQICSQIDLSDLSKDRIRIEFKKLFQAKHLHFGLYYLCQTGVAKKLFGIEPDRNTYIKIALTLQKAIKNIETIPNGLFFYVISNALKLSSVQLHSKIESTNAMQKATCKQKRVPKKITDRFLIGISITMPLSEWLGSYITNCKSRALHLGIWESCYLQTAKPEDAIKLGLSGAHIGSYLRSERSKEIRNNFTKRAI